MLVLEAANFDMDAAVNMLFDSDSSDGLRFANKQMAMEEVLRV